LIFSFGLCCIHSWHRCSSTKLCVQWARRFSNGRRSCTARSR